METKGLNSTSYLKSFMVLPGVFLTLWILNYLMPLKFLGMDFNNYTQRMWFLSMISLGISSFYIIMIIGKLDRRSLLVGLVLALPLLPWSIVNSLITFLTYYAGSQIFKGTVNRIRALEGRPKSIFKSILLGIVIAIPLGSFNVFMAVSGNNMTVNPQNPLWAAAYALIPGISEEVIFRYFIFALCVFLLKDKLESRKTKFFCITMMVLPHVLLHLPDTFLINPVNGFVSMVMLSILFGLPMAILQFKRGLEAAIAMHWFIDFMRFFILGA